jgi:hypothetical protein
VRKELAKIDGERCSFQGVFVRYGLKSGWKGNQERTVLLRDIRGAAGYVVTDHLWFNLTKGFQGLGELAEGDVILFDARVKEYEKGYKGRREDVYAPIELDYKLSHPTRIRRPGTGEAPANDQP